MADGAYSEEAGKWLSHESIPDPLGNSNNNDWRLEVRLLFQGFYLSFVE